jgi:hypothetical protein
MSGPQCYTQKIVTARKYHKCCECRRLIEPGHQYEVYSGIWEDEPHRFKTCLMCCKIKDNMTKKHDFHDYYGDEGLCFSQLSEAVYETEEREYFNWFGIEEEDD